MTTLAIVGRSSSHFTRVVRIFAEELGVASELRVVRDLQSREADDYGGHPGLKMPSLQADGATWFGALPACRELARRAARPVRVVWPEDLSTPLLSNAQELAVHAMSTGVALIMSKLGHSGPDTAHQDKMRASLLGAVAWLDAHADRFLADLPDRDLSFLEVTLFCLVEHLAFRDVVPVVPYAALERFRAGFARRHSARATAYRFDA